MDYKEENALNFKYFNSTKNYTLSLLNALNNVKYYVHQDSNEFTDKVYTIPITFGNYEKCIALEDLSEKDIKSGNINVIPRLVLSFDGMTRNTSRSTSKFQKFKKRIKLYTDNNTVEYLNMSYNSVPYDFNFRLLLQTRGMSSATQIVEQILAYFNPTMGLFIKEFPLFEEKTETQISITDPEFEIIDEFENTQINIINVTFNLSIRGNIYNHISYQYPIKRVGILMHIWDDYLIESSKLSTQFKYDINENTHKPEKETVRHFYGTEKIDEFVKSYPSEEKLIQKRKDYNPPQTETMLNEGSE